MWRCIYMAARLIFFKYTSYSDSQTLGFEDEYQYLFNITIMPATYEEPSVQLRTSTLNLLYLFRGQIRYILCVKILLHTFHLGRCSEKPVVVNQDVTTILMG